MFHTTFSKVLWYSTIWTKNPWWVQVKKKLIIFFNWKKIKKLPLFCSFSILDQLGPLYFLSGTSSLSLIFKKYISNHLNLKCFCKSIHENDIIFLRLGNDLAIKISFMDMRNCTKISTNQYWHVPPRKNYLPRNSSIFTYYEKT